MKKKMLSSRLRSRGERSESVAKRIKKVLLSCAGGIMIVSLFLTGSISAEAAADSNQSEIPKELQIIFEKVGESFEICPELMESMAWRESRFEPTVKSGNCYGLMQVNIKVHKDRIEKYGYTSEDMLDPEPNIIVAADYLKELFDTYGDDDPLILLYYSGSKSQIAKYKEYGFINSYVKDVLTRAADYERKHGK